MHMNGGYQPRMNRGVLCLWDLMELSIIICIAELLFPYPRRWNFSTIIPSVPHKWQYPVFPGIAFKRFCWWVIRLCCSGSDIVRFSFGCILVCILFAFSFSCQRHHLRRFSAWRRYSLPFSVCRYRSWACRWSRRYPFLRQFSPQYACPLKHCRQMQK